MMAENEKYKATVERLKTEEQSKCSECAEQLQRGDRFVCKTCGSVYCNNCMDGKNCAGCINKQEEDTDDFDIEETKMPKKKVIPLENQSGLWSW